MPVIIRRVYANSNSFKVTEFEPGFNVVLAVRTKESTKTDTRNGLGKTTLIAIINFCLGGNLDKKLSAVFKELKWEFFCDLTLNGQDITVLRQFDSKSIIAVYGGEDISWPIPPEKGNGCLIFTQKQWNLVLGTLLFDLSITPEKYFPSYRSLVSYCIRHNPKESYLSPFEHHKKQAEWDKQVHNTFLLNLDWRDAVEWQVLKDKKKLLGSLQKTSREASEAGISFGINKSIGELRTLRIRLQSQIEEESRNLENYNVHPQYKDIQSQASSLTKEIHDLADENISDEKLLAFYAENIEAEQDVSASEITELYESIGVHFPNAVHKRLEEAEVFHRTVIENRKKFLESEINQIKRSIESRDQIIDQKSSERARLFQVLQTHGALEEYTQLQRIHLENVERLNQIAGQIEVLTNIEEQRISLRIEEDALRQKARLDYENRLTQITEAISLFNENSRFLYRSPGSLIIDIEKKGFDFKVEIERSGSTGIENMKIFCYDLMLAEIWSQQKHSPKIIIHDNIIFNGVDERQVALALELAAQKSEDLDFQYICTLNSDEIPYSDFSEDFSLDDKVRLTLTDTTPEGGLLGFRLSSN